MQAIYLYSLGGAKNTQVTDGMSDAENPVFDKNGKYLYFTASTNSGAAMQPDIESFFAAGHGECVSWLCWPTRSVSAGAGKRRRKEEADDAKKDEAKKDDQERRRTRAPKRWRSKSIWSESASAFWRFPCRPSGT
jgi:hypothetical protein